MAKFIELRSYWKDSAVLINKNIILSVSPHRINTGSVVRLRFNKEFHVAESVEEVIAKLKEANNG